MTLQIKGSKEHEPLIELVGGSVCVLVKIDHEIVADFDHDGSFTFYGSGHEIVFQGRWDK